MKNRLIVSENEKQSILNQHMKHGYKTLIDESSEIQQNYSNDQFLDDILSSLPQESNQSNFCVGDTVSMSKVDGHINTTLTKVLGNDSMEFKNKFDEYTSRLDKTNALNLIKTIKGFISNPKQGFEELKNIIGFKKQMEEQVGLAVGAGVLILLFGYLIIKLITKIFSPKAACKRKRPYGKFRQLGTGR